MAQAIGFVLSLLLTVGSQPATVSPAKALDSQSVEFPPFDDTVWRLYAKGATEKLASELLARAPDNIDTLEILLRAKRVHDALAVLRRIAERHPNRIPRAFEIVARDGYRFLPDEGRGYNDVLQQIFSTARKRLPELPREQAAQAAWHMLSGDTEAARAAGGWPKGIAAFVQEYAGTETALLAEVDVIASRDFPTIEGLERFARDHPQTSAAAKALYTLGSRLRSSPPTKPGTVPAEPGDRFTRVLGIASELASGKYPPSEWVERAPTLATWFYVPDNTPYAPETIDRMLEAYVAIVKAEFVLDDRNPANNGIGYLVTTTIPELVRKKHEDDASAAMDQLFSELERDIPDKTAVRYLKGLYYTKNTFGGSIARESFQKTRETLTAAYTDGKGIYRRKALATLASLYFYQRDYSNARDHYTKYLQLYPQSAWAWVAALRVGQCAEQMGDWNGAVIAYRSALTKYGNVPLARVLGHAYAARAWEALGRLDDARKEHERALAAWDRDYGFTYSIQAFQTRVPDLQINACAVQDPWEVTKSAIPGRIDQLKQSARLPEGVLLERAGGCSNTVDVATRG